MLSGAPPLRNRRSVEFSKRNSKPVPYEEPYNPGQVEPFVVTFQPAGESYIKVRSLIY